jgi:hypothetical protein
MAWPYEMCVKSKNSEFWFKQVLKQTKEIAKNLEEMWKERSWEGRRIGDISPFDFPCRTDTVLQEAERHVPDVLQQIW